jgi:hypothetical protein
MLSRTIVFYIFVIVVFVLYWYITLQIYKEQFLVEGPLTFLEDGNIIFLLSQNKYCYSDTLQLFLEGAFTSTLGLALGTETQKLIIDKIRGTNKSLDIFALDFTNPKGSLVPRSSGFNNNSNEVNSEIKISIADYDKLDKSVRPSGNYIINGDIVYLSVNRLGAEGYRTYLYTTSLDNDNPSVDEHDLLFNDFEISVTPDGLNQEEKDKYKWRIQIDKEYSEDRFDSKIVDFACVVFTRKNNSNGKQIELRLGMDCKYGDQVSKITGLLWDYVGEIGQCGVTKVIDSVGSLFGVDDLTASVDLTLNKHPATASAYDRDFLIKMANRETAFQRCNTNDDCDEEKDELCVGADNSNDDQDGYCYEVPDNAKACAGQDTECNVDARCTQENPNRSGYVEGDDYVCVRDYSKSNGEKIDYCSEASIDSLVARIDSVGREREITVSGCTNCNHWQVRIKK